MELFFKGKLAKGASHVKLPMKNQTLINVRKKEKLPGNFSILAHLHPPGDNPKRVTNHTKNLHEIKIIEIDLTDG